MQIGPIIPATHHPVNKPPVYRSPNATISSMTTFHQTEPTANNALADLLRPMLPDCQVRSEQTQTIIDHPGQHGDVLVTAIGRSPVFLEAEYDPAPEAELDAGKRLGVGVHGEPRTVEAAIALRYPVAIAGAYNLHESLAAVELSYCVLYEDGSRFPQSGWLTGSVTDLADLVRLVSVPQKAVDKAADTLQKAIDDATSILNQMPQSRPDISPAIAKRLNMSDVPQMRRMACAIIANAMLFHERLAGRHGIKPLQQVCGAGVENPQLEILEAWESILQINYLDVFDIARAIVSELPTQEGAQILRLISFHVLQIAADGINNDHDLTGRVFQRLIADRKYLATYYTLPASAFLLAGLAVGKMDVDWSNLDAIGQLRIADFACGTGALLSAVTEQITSRFERNGGDVTKLHPIMMERVLYGCDVMPSAVHITGSTLAGLQPSVGFSKTNLTTMPYGRQPDGSVAIGSLELLGPNSPLAKQVPDESLDLVIMNPPFTRATNHEGSHATVTNPVFAAFNATPADQTAMGKRINRLGKGTCYHGNAGISSAFVALADRKLEPGGVLALVLPLSVASGLSWRGVRQLLAAQYDEVQVLSIAQNGHQMSFSSDTGMAECLVVARKVLHGEPAGDNIRFASFDQRPSGFPDSAEVSRQIRAMKSVRRIEDGPYSGTPLRVGDGAVGEIVTHQPKAVVGNWGSVRLRDFALAQTAHCLTIGELWLPAQPRTFKHPTCPLDGIGYLGFVHRDITGPVPRGPFDKAPPRPTSTYPALWNHDAKKETRIVCEPDSQLQVRSQMEGKAAEVWATASKAHINLEFTMGSQALAVAFTDRATIGGVVWPNVLWNQTNFDHTFSIWVNSTLGLLTYWWHSNRQQSSKIRLTIRSAESLPVLDFRTLSDEQLATAQDIFDDFRGRDLMPAYLADADRNRALLDRRVVCDLLGFDDATYRGVGRLAQKWCAEPSVHGGKTRPKDATYVE